MSTNESGSSTTESPTLLDNPSSTQTASTTTPMVPHTRSQGPPPPVVPLPPATRPRRQSAASPTTPTDDYVTSADEDEGPNASGERPATTPLTNNDQARLSAGLAALVRQREEDVRRQMETIADLREQVQVLARRNQLLMDDHDEIVRVHRDPRPVTPPSVATPVQVPVPLPVPVPVINPWPVPQVQVQPPTPGFDPTQYASTMNQLNRPPRAARGATPEDIRRVTAGPLRDLMTSTSAAVQQPRQAYPQVPGNTFYHAQLNPPGPPPPAYPQNEVQAARVVTWGPHVRAFPPLYEQPPDYNPGPAPPRAAAPPPDPGDNDSSDHNSDNPPP